MSFLNKITFYTIKAIVAFFIFIIKMLFALPGFDVEIISRLEKHQKVKLFFTAMMTLSMAAYTAAGVGYGAFLTGATENIAWVFGGIGFLFCLNIGRMLNAGGGYPVGKDIDNIKHWSPALASTFFLCLIGGLITTPNILYIYSLIEHGATGVLSLFDLWDEMWLNKPLAIGLTIGSMLLFSAFSWLRFLFLDTIRAS